MNRIIVFIYINRYLNIMVGFMAMNYFYEGKSGVLLSPRFYPPR